MKWRYWQNQSQDKEPKPKSKVREWWDAILFAVIAATLIRWLIMEPYVIPTPSMEGSLLVGDFLFVSKFHYGTRTTSTPLQVPLTHQKIWLTNLQSYVEWIKLPNYRLPGFTKIKREDVVVFNVPGVEENNFENPNRSSWIEFPVDLKTNYVKRCVAIPGDTLSIRNKIVYANGVPINNPPGMQFNYQLVAKDQINERNLKRLGINRKDIVSVRGTSDGKLVYILSLTEEKLQKINAENASYILSVTPLSYNADENDYDNIFPYFNGVDSRKQYVNWTVDNFGPLWIPQKGHTITINDSTLLLYGHTIKKYDHNENVIIKDGILTIDGRQVDEYTFKQNYYFMMGDNRHNSHDSRVWGFVPEDHIVGKASFIWLSLDDEASFFSKIRWGRLFNGIK